MRVTKVTPENAGSIITTLKQAPVVGIDTETTALTPREGKLRLIQLAHQTTEGVQVYVLDAFQSDPQLLAPVFDGNTRLAGHNLGFDLRFLSSVGLDIPFGKNLFDTMIGTQLLDCGILPRKGHRLSDVSQEYLGFSVSKEEQTSDWSGTLTRSQVNYAATDAAVLLPLHDRVADRIIQADLQPTMDLEMRCLPGMVWCTLAGMPIDRSAWIALAHKAKDDVEMLEYALAEHSGTQDALGWSWINWRSPAQILDYYHSIGKTLPLRDKVLEDGSVTQAESTADDALAEMQADGDELAGLISKYREKTKLRDTYGLEWADKWIRDGRVYADIAQIGAFTGRMACRNPNLQQIPHAKEYRSCFVAPEGETFVISDYSQIELRIMVEWAHDEAGLRAYCVDKTDLHKATARLILGNDSKEARQVAKSLNFGLVFGAGARTLQLYALKTYGVRLSLEEAQKLRNEWRQIYKGIVAKHRSVREGVEAVRTLGGRRRLNVDKYTEKLNTPVQGTGIDGLKAGIALCYERRDQIPSSAKPVIYVHDEIVFQCKQEDGDIIEPWLKHNMEEGMQNFLKIVPAVAETAQAKNWSDKA
jgi:DNA polymerase-1